MANKILGILLVVLAMAFLFIACASETAFDQAEVVKPKVDSGISEAEAE